MCACAPASICAQVHVCMRECMRGCMGVRPCVRSCVRACVRSCVRACVRHIGDGRWAGVRCVVGSTVTFARMWCRTATGTYTLMHVPARKCKASFCTSKMPVLCHLHVHACVRACVRTWRACVRACMRACVSGSMPACMPLCVEAGPPATTKAPKHPTLPILIYFRQV